MSESHNEASSSHSLSATPATRSGTKYSARSSVGSVEKPRFKKAPTIITPGSKLSRLPVPVDRSRSAPPKPNVVVNSSGTVAVFGELPKETLLKSDTLLRLAELLSLQNSSKVHPYDIILERRLLANPADDLKLSNQISTSFKGDSKPLEHEIELGCESVRGTLHWRAQPPTGGHLIHTMEGTDCDILCRSFAWAVPLITIWPPPLVLGPDASENVYWELELQGSESGPEALTSVAKRLDDDQYCGALFAKVRTILIY